MGKHLVIDAIKLYPLVVEVMNCCFSFSIFLLIVATIFFFFGLYNNVNRLFLVMTYPSKGTSSFLETRLISWILLGNPFLYHNRHLYPPLRHTASIYLSLWVLQWNPSYGRTCPCYSQGFYGNRKNLHLSSMKDSFTVCRYLTLTYLMSVFMNSCKIFSIYVLSGV